MILYHESTEYKYEMLHSVHSEISSEAKYSSLYVSSILCVLIPEHSVIIITHLVLQSPQSVVKVPAFSQMFKHTIHSEKTDIHPQHGGVKG